MARPVQPPTPGPTLSKITAMQKMGNGREVFLLPALAHYLLPLKEVPQSKGQILRATFPAQRLGVCCDQAGQHWPTVPLSGARGGLFLENMDTWNHQSKQISCKRKGEEKKGKDEPAGREQHQAIGCSAKLRKAGLAWGVQGSW